MMKAASAEAYANIALVKYWGKRDPFYNLPMTGSLSVTLSPLKTVTRVEVRDEDCLILNGKRIYGQAFQRIRDWLRAFRTWAEIKEKICIKTRNDFPTSAGLASSASGFAALVGAMDRCFGLHLNPADLSRWARRGSGSAARSIYGGYVEMQTGEDEEAIAHPLWDGDYFPLWVKIPLIQTQKKRISSRKAMELTRMQSPYFQAWIQSVDRDLREAKDALREQNFWTLAKVAERSALRMHASAMAADPGILFWEPETVSMIHAVRQWQEEGIPIFFTIDAGANVKIFGLPEAKSFMTQALSRAFPQFKVIDAWIGKGMQAHDKVIDL